MTSPRLLRRGDTSPKRPGKVFYRYDGVLSDGVTRKEDWVTPERLKEFTARDLEKTARHMARRKEKWTKDSPRQFKRRDTSPDHPGKVFWGYWHYGMERWVTPEKFEELRIKDNAAAIGFKPSEASKARAKITSRIRNQRPEKKARNAEYQREKRHIYSPRYREKRRAYKKERMETDPIFRLKANVGTRIRSAFARQCVRKQTRCAHLLGCTFPVFKDWIGAQFEPGMSFENYGFETWHVDHIIPLCLFDLADPIAAKYAFNYRNCRPAWGKPNLSKNGRLDMALVAKHELWEWLPYTKQPALKQAA